MNTEYSFIGDNSSRRQVQDAFTKIVADCKQQALALEVDFRAKFKVCTLRATRIYWMTYLNHQPQILDLILF
jgi:hypothetical protein